MLKLSTCQDRVMSKSLYRRIIPKTNKRTQGFSKIHGKHLCFEHFPPTREKRHVRRKQARCNPIFLHVLQIFNGIYGCQLCKAFQGNYLKGELRGKIDLFLND